MRFRHTRIELDRVATPDGQHMFFFDREPGSRWLVACSPMLADKVEWRTSTRGAKLPVPLVPYLTKPDLDLALAFSLQLGCLLQRSLPASVECVHIVTGTPIHEVSSASGEPPQWRVLLGFAVLLGE